MFLDSLPQTLTPLELGGAGAANVQQGLSQTLRAVLDVQVRTRCAACRRGMCCAALCAVLNWTLQ